MRAKGAPAREVERARIVLLAADGVSGVRIAERVGCSEPTVIRWRSRFAEDGLAGLVDEPRSGKPPTIDQAVRDEILSVTLTEPPVELGITHWSSSATRRSAAPRRQTGVALDGGPGVAPVRDSAAPFGHVQVLHRSRARGEDPRRRRAVPRPAGEGGGAVRGREVPDPGLGPDRADPAGAPRAAGVPHPRLRPARHDHPVRGAGGPTGKVTDACYQRHRHQEFLRFLKQVATAYPRVRYTWSATTTPRTSIRR